MICENAKWSNLNQIGKGLKSKDNQKKLASFEQPSSNISSIGKQQPHLIDEKTDTTHSKETYDQLMKTCPPQSTRKLNIHPFADQTSLQINSAQKNINGMDQLNGKAMNTQSSMRNSVGSDEEYTCLHRNNSSKIIASYKQPQQWYNMNQNQKMIQMKYSVSPLQCKQQQALMNNLNQEMVFDYTTDLPSNQTNKHSASSTSQKDRQIQLSKIIDQQAVVKAQQQKKHPNFFFQQALPNQMLQQPISQLKLSSSLNMNISHQDIPAFYVQNSQNQLQNQHLLFMSPSARKNINPKKVLQPAPVRSAFGGTVSQNGQVYNKAQFQQMPQNPPSTQKYKDQRNTVLKHHNMHHSAVSQHQTLKQVQQQK